MLVIPALTNPVQAHVNSLLISDHFLHYNNIITMYGGQNKTPAPYKGQSHYILFISILIVKNSKQFRTDFFL
jgi:hypothetical protein